MKRFKRFFITLGFVLLAIPIVALIIHEAVRCDHDYSGRSFSFQSEGSTAASWVKPYCVKCDKRSGGYTSFTGTPDDLSYLEALKANSDSDEFVGGEYYTITAKVTLGYFSFNGTRFNCMVESGDTVVGFSVEFREELEEQVSQIEKDDMITFYGRLYDEGCGFTDCVLVE